MVHQVKKQKSGVLEREPILRANISELIKGIVAISEARVNVSEQC